jgi:ABC-type glycerol-3-phosphate transport system substrate-binding protein
MKFFKKPFVYLLVAVLVFSSGCSLFRTKDPADPVDKTEKEIVFYNMFDESEVFEPLMQQYLADNPYTRIVYKRFDDFEKYEKRILNELAEGEGPDIFVMPNTWFVKNKKKLAQMPSTQGTLEGFMDTFVDVAARDLATTDSDGIVQVYGMPMYVDTLALYYNNDHFEDRLPNQSKPSATWSGIKNDVYALVKNANIPSRFEVAGIAMGLTENVSDSVDILYALMIQNGTVFYDDIMSKALFTNSITGGKTPASDALEFYTSFANKSQKHYAWNEHMDGDIEAFVKGEVSMIFGYSHTYGQILEERNLKSSVGEQVIDISAIKTANLPQVVDPTESTDKRDTYANYFALGVARTSDFSEAAWDFITFLTTPESERFYFEKTHKPTSRRDLIAEQRLDPVYGVFADQIGYAESFPVTDYLEYKGIFSNAIDTVNNGGSAKNVLTAVQDMINLMLPQEGYVVPLNTDYYEQLQE